MNTLSDTITSPKPARKSFFRRWRSSPQTETPEPDGLSDDPLLVAASRGDREAFAAIVKEHQTSVFGFLRARMIEPSDAEDLCQEVFLRSYQNCAEFRRATSIRGWLIGIARNVLREHVRRTSRRKEVAWTHLCLELDELLQTKPSETCADEASEHLPVCLESLGQSARQAIDLRYRDQKKLAEIGSQTGRSEGAVKLLMFRARQALRNCLDRKLNQASP